MLKRGITNKSIILNTKASQSILTKNFQTTQCAHYAEYAQIRSKDLNEAKLNVLLLYRRFCKILPWMREVYHIPADLSVMQKRIRKEFKSYNAINDRELIDALVIRGYIEHEEATMHHKQRGHVLKFFSEAEIDQATPELAEFKRILKEKVDTESSFASVEGKGMGRNIGKYLKNYRDN